MRNSTPMSGTPPSHDPASRRAARRLARYTALVRVQRERIATLKASVQRLRVELLLRDTALAWARQDRAALEAAIPGLPTRLALARQVQDLTQRLRTRPRQQPAPPARWQVQTDQLALHEAPAADLATLEASLRAADLVICQTGCLSHNAYWRVEDHCRRTGKTCVMLEGPAPLRVVRIAATAVELDT